MKHFVRIFGTVGAFALMSAEMMTGATAHVGHIGELAGHSHWVGAAALAGAVALAGLLAIKGKKKKAAKEKQQPDAAPDAGKDTAEGETA